MQAIILFGGEETGRVPRSTRGRCHVYARVGCGGGRRATIHCAAFLKPLRIPATAAAAAAAAAAARSCWCARCTATAASYPPTSCFGRQRWEGEREGGSYSPHIVVVDSGGEMCAMSRAKRGHRAPHHLVDVSCPPTHPPTHPRHTQRNVSSEQQQPPPPPLTCRVLKSLTPSQAGSAARGAACLSQGCRGLGSVRVLHGRLGHR